MFGFKSNHAGKWYGHEELSEKDRDKLEMLYREDIRIYNYFRKREALLEQK